MSGRACAAAAVLSVGGASWLLASPGSNAWGALALTGTLLLCSALGGVPGERGVALGAAATAAGLGIWIGIDGRVPRLVAAALVGLGLARTLSGALAWPGRDGSAAGPLGRLGGGMVAAAAAGAWLAGTGSPVPAVLIGLSAGALAPLLLRGPRRAEAARAAGASPPTPFVAAGAAGGLALGVLAGSLGTSAAELPGAPAGVWPVLLPAAALAIASQAWLLGGWIRRHGEELVLLALLLVSAAGLFLVASARGRPGLGLGLAAAAAATAVLPTAASALLRLSGPAAIGWLVTAQAAAGVAAALAARPALAIRPTLPYYAGALLVSLVYVALAMAWRRNPVE